MVAKAQYKLVAADLEVLLAMVRGGTLAAAGERLGVDASTVFRTVQRIEKGIGQRLFERTRSGYQPLELAQSLAVHAEQLEAGLESARSEAQQRAEDVSGTVRITTTDTILHGLVAPALLPLRERHPLLDFELHTGNELANLTRRDADIAVRATKRPPQHLVGKHVGPIRVALYGPASGGAKKFDEARAAELRWIAPDDALPQHPSVIWRRKHFPRISPAYRVDSILTVMELVACGLGVGALPLFLAKGNERLRQLTGVLEECQSELWLLTHAEARHLRRVATVFGHLAKTMKLA